MNKPTWQPCGNFLSLSVSWWWQRHYCTYTCESWVLYILLHSYSRGKL